MLKIVLVAVVIMLSGHAEHRAVVFDTVEECEQMKTKVIEGFADFNATNTEHDKVLYMAVDCMPFERAPNGEPM